MKIKCSMCKLEKETTEFYTDKARYNGYGSHCKVCQRVYLRKYNYERRQKTKNLRTYAKFTIKKVSKFDLKGKYLETYSNCQKAGRQTGINSGNIGSAARGTRPSAGGYFWRYTEAAYDLKEGSLCQHCGKEISIDDRVIVSIDCLQAFKERMGNEVL